MVAQGQVPFAVLDDGRVISARFLTTITPRPPSSLSDAEETRWTLVLGGREFAVAGHDWLPIGAAWARGGETPLPAQATGDGHVVRYDFFYAHHLGWLSGPVVLTFDLATMTVTVDAELRFEPD